MTKVSIIVLSYNTEKLLRNCIESIYKYVKDVEFEVIVVDNASSDYSVEMVKKSFRNARVIANEKNYGFTKGNNIGAEKAKGEFLLFLNSDTELIDNPLPVLLNTFEKQENVGVAGGLLRNFNGTYQRSYGPFYTIPRVAQLLFVGDRIELIHPFAKEQFVDWVSGGFMMVKNSLFKQLEGFDEKIFMYIEDVEFCFRVKKKGLLVFFQPKAVVKHMGQGSSNREFAVLQIYKGLIHFYTKHKPSELFLLKTLLKTKALIALIIGSFTGNSYLISTFSKALKI